ncbi:MAG: hypothetical protein HC915_10990, partial [Anaerolineae bacterium]|nr:hypothetical protein [Anaerolineae bacterium]
MPPFFSDHDPDDLPDWLRDDDSDSATGEPAPADDLRWLLDDDDAAAPPATGPDQGLNLQGLTGMLPWRQGMSDAGDAPAGQDDLPELDWGSSGPAEAAPADPLRPGLTGMLPWRQGVSEADDTPGPLSGDEIAAWLDEVDSVPEDQAAPGWMQASAADPLAAPEPAADLLDWLNAAAPTRAESLTEPAEVPPSFTVEPADDTLPDWLRVDTEQFTSAEPALPAAPLQAEPDADDLGWLGEAEAEFGAAQDASNLTYEEWEREQQAAEVAAQRPYADDEVNALPDWDEDLSDAAPARPNTGTFVPDWFMGVEELSADEAPEWMRESLAPPPAPALPDFSDFAVEDEAPGMASWPGLGAA